jgi:signal transduction histidine kinase
MEGVALLEWGVARDLDSAFENLIDNAIKYSRPGGRVTIQLRMTSETVVVRIMDEGIGIPADHLDQVFLEFVRAPSAKRHAAGGTGLGLAIVREAVEAHGGRVAVDSLEGCTFTVTFPLHYTPPEMASRRAQQGP